MNKKSNNLDIHSLMIKPVQRVLKYTLLLGGIIKNTPSKHMKQKKKKKIKRFRFLKFNSLKQRKKIFR